MANHLLLVSLGLLLALLSGSTEALRPLPKCSSAFVASTALHDFKDACPQIHDPIVFEHIYQRYNSNSSYTLKKFDLLEGCSCNLLNHELTWASLMKHEVMVLYEAIKHFIDNHEDVKMKKIIEGGTKVFFQGEEGKRRFYWEAIDFIFEKARDFMKRGARDVPETIYLQIATTFSQLYYDNIFTLNYVGQEKSGRLQEEILKTCMFIHNNFSLPFMDLFKNLTRLSGNFHYFYLLTTYNEDLYKLRMVHQVCEFLDFHGVIYPKNFP